MRTSRCFPRWVAVLAFGSMGCLLYTDPINMPPGTPTIEGPQGPDQRRDPPRLARGEKGVFTARAEDPDGAASKLRFEWRRGEGTCDKGVAAAQLIGVAASHTETGTLNGFCLWAVAIDEHGARSAPDAHEVKGDNAEPKVMLEVVSPGTATEYPRYSQFRVSAAKSTDPEMDQLRFTWSLTRPRAMAMPLESCTGDDDTAACFAGSDEGEYVVDVVAVDVHGAEGRASLKLKVLPDAPPCIELTTPDVARAPQIFYNPKDKLTLSVLGVNDDGDPYPHPGPVPANVGFRWKYRLKGEADFTRRFEYTLPYLEIGPDVYQVGDVVEVRVEYRDRVDRSFATCNQNDPTCALGANKQCHQWVTWTINYRL